MGITDELLGLRLEKHVLTRRRNQTKWVPALALGLK